MTYCNWCMLESDTDDVCVWCKRPLKAKAVYSQARNDLHYLREQDDDPDGGFPIAAVIGGSCFLLVVLMAVLSFRNAAEKPAQDNSHWVLQKDSGPSQSQGPTQGETSGSGKFGGGAPSASGSAFGPPPTATVVQQPTPPPSTAPRRTPPAESAGAGHTWAWNKLDTWDVIPISSARLYFESADFKFVNDSGGVPRLVGDIVVVNDTFDNVENARLWLTVNNSTYPLLRYDGTINAPKVLPAFTIASKSTLNCHVFARDFDGRTKGSGARRITLGAFIQGKPVRFTSDLKG